MRRPEGKTSTGLVRSAQVSVTRKVYRCWAIYFHDFRPVGLSMLIWSAAALCVIAGNWDLLPGHARICNRRQRTKAAALYYNSGSSFPLGLILALPLCRIARVYKQSAEYFASVGGVSEQRFSLATFNRILI